MHIRRTTLGIILGISFRSYSAFTPPFSSSIESIRSANGVGVRNVNRMSNSDSTSVSVSTSQMTKDEMLFESSTSTSKSRSSRSSSSFSSIPSPSPSSPSEFELMLGKAMDTLRKDYPLLLTDDPDFSIYDPNIEVVDPSGFTLHNVQDYKRSFQLVHMLAKLFYCPSQSVLTFRLIYDCARKNIRISWNAVLVPRLGVPPASAEDVTTSKSSSYLHVDGISVYELDPLSGLINQHRVEHLLVNDVPLEAPQGIFQAIANKAGPELEGIPVWNLKATTTTTAAASLGATTTATTRTNVNANHVFQYNTNNKFLPNVTTRSTSKSILFASSDNNNNNDDEHPQSPSPSSEIFNEEEYNKKNAARKRFGLPPISQDEFIKIELQTRELQIEQAQKQEAAASQSAAEMTQSKPKKGNFLGNFLENIALFQDTCESNYDCERPEVCCDFGFKKQCCRSGQGVINGMPGQKLERIPIRVVADDGLQRGGPSSDDMIY